MKILVLNGPNINMLGVREPEIYGSNTYEDLVSLIVKEAHELNCEICIRQSNHEGDLVDEIQSAVGKFDGIIINPAAYTHTSIALLDAVKAVGLPTIEVHITDPDKREEFRRESFIREACVATVKGEGIIGYVKALRLMNTLLTKSQIQ